MTDKPTDINDYPEEDENMENRTNIDDFLTVRGFGGYGGGYMGGGRGGSLYTGNNVLAAEAHANGTATKEAIDCSAASFRDGLSRISEQNDNQSCNDRISRVSDQITNQEFRTLDRLRDVERDIGENAKDSAVCCCDTQKLIAELACNTQKAIADAAKDAAQCCCDAKLEACKNTADIKALIISENGATRELIRGDALSAANAKITQLETINALSGYHHK